MDILARLHLVKIRTMAQPNLPDVPPKRNKNVRLGVNIQPSVEIENSTRLSALPTEMCYLEVTGSVPTLIAYYAS